MSQTKFMNSINMTNAARIHVAPNQSIKKKDIKCIHMLTI
jgi:hypothetical protein